MLTAVLVVTVLVLESCSSLDNMGKCASNLQKGTAFNFEQFAGEHNHKWCVVRGPKTSFTLDLKSLSYNIITKKDKIYNLKMYYERYSTDPKTVGGKQPFTDETMRDLGGGIAQSSGTTLDNKHEQFVLNIYFIKYVPGRYVYYYICSPKGADTTIDYRYVLAYSTLKPNEVDDINRIDKEKGFKGQLIPIGNINCF